ncbi:GIY-YIG nuclease family protein [Bacillus wiedmannii]|nr:GIY-YIG nuclease family protein [Bacillus wiedmannii]MED2864958.1 GIY-YIG nuclease family protein [Bacillus thuringiensis]
MSDIQSKLLMGTKYIEKIQRSNRIMFNGLKPSQLPSDSGVYIIKDKIDDTVLYVGRTLNLQRRIYTNHLQGNLSTARLKKYLIEDPSRNEVIDLKSAKEFLKKRCYVQFIIVQDNHKIRGKLECLFTFAFDAYYVEPERGKRN